LYQDPIIAWKFTKVREAGEGRNIQKEVFIREFFGSKNCVNQIKMECAEHIELWLIKKDFTNQGIEKIWFNIDNVDTYLKIEYTPVSLNGLLE